MNLDINLETLIPFLILLSSIFSFRASRNHAYRKPLMIASSAFMVIILSYAIPILGALLIVYSSVNSMTTLENYLHILELISATIMTFGYLLLTISMYIFGTENKNK